MNKILKYFDLGIYYFGYILFLIGLIRAIYYTYVFNYRYSYVTNEEMISFSLSFVSLTVTGVYFIRSYKKD